MLVTDKNLDFSFLQKTKKKTVRIIEETKSEEISEKPNGVESVNKKSIANNDDSTIKGLTIRRLSEPRNRSSASLHSIELDDDDNIIPKGTEWTNFSGMSY